MSCGQASGDLEETMAASTISSRFRVTIPKEVRETLELHPGQLVEVMAFDRRVELIPVRPAREMRGFLSGIETDVPREF
jgi:AbrB family looped-hinge helix DNA binding protein